MYTPKTAKGRLRSQGTCQKLQEHARSELSARVERCTAVNPTSRPQASTAGAHKAPDVHFHSVIHLQKPSKHTHTDLNITNNFGFRAYMKYPCDDSGEQLEEGSEAIQLSLSDPSDGRVAILHAVGAGHVSSQVLVVEH